ncbi:MAG: hypothetical protein R2881_09795 [Eubacteriales bacterium]
MGKTANVVGDSAFGIPAIAVDTHMCSREQPHRVGERKNVEKTEEQLQKTIPKRTGPPHHQLIYHGRQICRAARKQSANSVL